MLRALGWSKFERRGWVCASCAQDPFLKQQGCMWTDESDREMDRGAPHREHVLSRIAKLWERHPTLSFCDLIHRHVISIGTMAGHTSDEDVVKRCRDELEGAG